MKTACFGALLACAALLAGSCSQDVDTQAARLAELEAQMHTQQSRQEQLEARVAATLGQLADRVDALVAELRVQTGAGSDPVDAQPGTSGALASTVTGVPAATAPSPSDRPSRVDADAARVRAAERTAAVSAEIAGRQQFWMWCVVVAGTVAGVWLAWRRRRGEAPVVGRSKSDVEGESDRDCGAWSAAGVLTEAIGPHKAHQAKAHDSALGLRDAADVLGPLQEVFVLDPTDGLAAELDFASAPEQPAVAAEDPLVTSSPAREPLRWSFQLEAKDPLLARATIDAYLRHDPRVLQRPAPVVRDHPSGLAVDCALLPGLVAGEREHLRATLQRLVAVR